MCANTTFRDEYLIVQYPYRCYMPSIEMRSNLCLYPYNFCSIFTPVSKRKYYYTYCSKPPLVSNLRTSIQVVSYLHKYPCCSIPAHSIHAVVLSSTCAIQLMRICFLKQTKINLSIKGKGVLKHSILKRVTKLYAYL